MKPRGEVSPSWYFKEGDVPWILKKDDHFYGEGCHIGCEGTLFIWVMLRTKHQYSIEKPQKKYSTP
jgi:hypothetical protein